ncbi:F-box domain-containing protein [Mycena venus]|uniref:F-box domain-containing protein n=1 Tax=Mycena venus TaxID=2733690 RepID=A0A8H6YC74_9AGAR|nr:F-box domain-containing protein [Mycena venus]
MASYYFDLMYGSSNTESNSCPNCMTICESSDHSDLKLTPFTPTPVSRDILDSSDHSPLESQIPFLRDFIPRGRTRLAVLNENIALLKASLDKLVEERDALDVEICKHEGALSLLRHIPLEILALVFAFTLPPYQPDAASAPWTVSAVCARWRTTALSQPRLWASIDLKYDRRNLTNGFRLETQLRRSGEIPLHAEFSVADGLGDMNDEDIHLFRILGAHSGHWGTISLTGNSDTLWLIKGFCKDPFSLLRELTIEMLDHRSIHPESLDGFKDAPVLQRVVVNKLIWMEDIPVRFVLPWPQLLLYSGSNSWATHLHALHRAHNLVDCCLEIRGDIPTVPPSPRILLPRLRCLSLSNPRFLECLETPALRELYCEFAIPVLPFLRRLQSSSRELRKLVLWAARSCPPAPAADFTPIVDAVPTITELALVLSLPAAFAYDFYSRADLAPALECLSIGGHAAVPLGVHIQVMDGIERRWQGRLLKSVKLVLDEPEFPAAILTTPRAQGMKFATFPQNETLLRDVVPPEMWIESEN